MRQEHGIKVHAYYADGTALFVCTMCKHTVSFIFFHKGMRSKATVEEVNEHAIAAYCYHCNALITNPRHVNVTRRHAWIKA